MRLRHILFLLMVPQLLWAQETVVTDPSQSMTAQPQELEAAGVTAAAPTMTVVEDTVFFSATAYQVEEDASLDDLLKRIPGIDVSGGMVTMYGKNIKELRLNGKRYFGGDVAAGLQNIPAYMIDKLGVYERESDYSRLTGVEDDEPVPVLDVKVKRSMMDGWNGSVTGGGGLPTRYAAKLNLDKITDEQHQTALANFGNIADKMSFGNASRTQLGGGASGEVDRRSAGYSFTEEKGSHQIDFDLQYSRRDHNTIRDGYTENILAAGSSYINSNSTAIGATNNPKASFRGEWRDTSGRSYLLRSSLSYTSGNDWSHGESVNYRQTAANPSSEADNLSKGFNGQFSGMVSFIFSQKSQKKKGRSYGITTTASYSGSSSLNATNYRTIYYKAQTVSRDTTRRQLQDNSSNDFGVSTKASWNEPLGKRFSLQLTASADFSRRTTDRSIYNIAAISDSWAIEQWKNASQLRESLPLNYAESLQGEVSYMGRYDVFTVPVTANLRMKVKKFNFTAGAKVTSQFTTLSWPGSEDLQQSVVYLAPNFTVNYNPQKNRKLSFTYRSHLGSPSISNLIPVSNGTNPLYVRYGNPYLKPSNIHNCNFAFNSSNVKKRTSFSVGVSGRIVQNQLSSSTIFDEETGGRTITPQNVNGTWGLTGNIVYNKGFGSGGFSLRDRLSSQYDNSVNFLYNNAIKADELNTTRRTMVKESLEGIYRNLWLELNLNAGGDYTAERSLLRPSLNQDPYTFRGGISATVSTRFRLRVGADFSAIVQRGFRQEAFNREYYILNASISQSFFKRKLVARFSANDILRNLPNFTRNFSAQSRTINNYNGVNSYCLFTLMWRFDYRPRK